MIKNNDVHTASILYLRTTKDIGPGLLSRIDYTDKELALRLAELFTTVSNFVYAGIIYEKINDIKNAAESFEKGRDYQRAILCYDKLNNKLKVAELKSILATQGSSLSSSFVSMNKHNMPQKESPFVLEDQEHSIEQSDVENNGIFSITDDKDQYKQKDLNDKNIYDANADKTQVLNPLSDQITTEQNHDDYDASNQTQVLNSQNLFTAPFANNNQLNRNLKTSSNINNDISNSIDNNQIIDQKYISLLLNSKFFNTLSDDEKNIILKEIQYITLDSQTQLTSVNGIYLVLEGKINLIQNENIIKNIVPVESFGYESLSNTSLNVSFTYISNQKTILALLSCDSLEYI